MKDKMEALDRITDVVLAYRPKSKIKKTQKAAAARRKKSKTKRRG